MTTMMTLPVEGDENDDYDCDDDGEDNPTC